MDYGIDLPALKAEKETMATRITSWNNRMVDIKK